MYLIYSLDLETLKPRIYDFCRSKDTVGTLLRNCATNFILIEHGERRAEGAFKDDVKDNDIAEDGYFLRLSTISPNQIDVFRRTTITQNGWTGRYVNVEVKRIMVFAVTEASLNLPIECSGRSTTKPQFDNEAQGGLYEKMLSELSISIQKRRSLLGNE